MSQVALRQYLNSLSKDLTDEITSITVFKSPYVWPWESSKRRDSSNPDTCINVWNDLLIAIDEIIKEKNE